jgi:hemin uptake protein HemP
MRTTNCGVPLDTTPIFSAMSNDSMEPQNIQPVTENDPAQPETRSVSSQELLQGESEILIVHLGEVYHLRQTRRGGLLLYK